MPKEHTYDNEQMASNEEYPNRSAFEDGMERKSRLRRQFAHQGWVSKSGDLQKLLARAKPKSLFARIDTLLITARKHNVESVLIQLVKDATGTTDFSRLDGAELTRVENRIFAIARALEEIDDGDVTFQ